MSQNGQASNQAGFDALPFPVDQPGPQGALAAQQNRPDPFANAWGPSGPQYPIAAHPQNRPPLRNGSRAMSQASGVYRQFPSGPHYVSHRRLLGHAVTNPQRKGLGGTHGDSALLNWFLSIAIVVGSTTALILSKNFLDAFARAADRDMEDYLTSYKATQYLMGLAVITLTFGSLYTLWVFMDARHPMRKAWSFGYNEGGGPPLKDDWSPWPWPAAGTMKFDKLNRLTLSRMFAARNHIQKLLFAQALFLIAWITPALLMAFKDGYVNFDRSRHNGNITVTQLCGFERSRELCMQLAKAGITAGVVTLLFAVALSSSFVGYIAKKTPSR